MTTHNTCQCGREYHQIYREMSHIVDFMEKDPDNLVLRRFDKLQLYNLLFLQHELSHITEKILGYEANEYKEEMQKLGEILPRLNKVLQSYHKALAMFKSTRNDASVPRYIRRVLESLDGEKKAALNHEYSIGGGWEDLVPIVAQDKGAIHRFIDDKTMLSGQFAKVSKSKSKSSLYYYSERAVRLLEHVIINALVLALIAGPVFSFAYIHSSVGKILLTLGCVIVAIPILSSLLPQSEKNHVALIFGYSAVLVAFTSQK